MSHPLTHPLPFASPSDYFSQLQRAGRAIVFLDSAQSMAELGRYSYIAVDPCALVTDFVSARQWLAQHQAERDPALPPFQGGLAGLISYDSGCAIALGQLQSNDQAAMTLGVFDLVLAFDHQTESAWIISSGLPESTADKRQQRASDRLAACLSWIAVTDDDAPSSVSTIDLASIKSNFSEATYCQAVRQAIDYILAGDIFEVNLAQRFSASLPAQFDTLALYQRLRAHNPAPFAAYVKLGGIEILSSSPERFVQVDNHHVQTRPIKGTIRRSIDPEADQRLAQQLLSSDKDRAENTMIVDLMRNDLSRVCAPFSVEVPQYCGLETYASVHHLVSVVTGRLESPNDQIDLLQATLPGGSITGAPKIRAIEVIDEIELHSRGVYCGQVVCLGWDGYLDSSILIRSLFVQNQVITWSAGGAIVADSDPHQEYQETLLKAQRLIEVLTAHDTVAR